MRFPKSVIGFVDRAAIAITVEQIAFGRTKIVPPNRVVGCIDIVVIVKISRKWLVANHLNRGQFNSLQRIRWILKRRWLKVLGVGPMRTPVNVLNVKRLAPQNEFPTRRSRSLQRKASYPNRGLDWN
jgi:hypothetical protein